MTCENCIHHDVCNEHHKLILTVDSLFELIYQYGVQYSCKSFKNKADYAEVARCKDCVFRHLDPDFASGKYCSLRNVNGGLFCEDDDYCSYGKRETGNERR